MAFDLALVILGFGFIVFVHELGHFVAARWAGIRVLAFAIGFGPPLLTYRKGIGVRRGSTEPEYFERFRQHHQRLADRSEGDLASSKDAPLADLAISPTEYRLNLLPFGGYVKMLGQDDLDPRATSAAPDSYQRCKPWKRMVVISAGVIMNLIVAAVLFVIVMMAGRQVDPPVIGGVRADSPAALATPADDATRRLLPRDGGAGLRTGDRVVSLNGSSVQTFNDVVMGVAMHDAGEPMAIEVERDGYAQTLQFEATPTKTILSPFLELGVDQAAGATVIDAEDSESAAALAQQLDNAGLRGVQPGATLVSLATEDGKAITPATGSMLVHALESGEGRTVIATFRNPSGASVDAHLTPRPRLQEHLVSISKSAREKSQRVANISHVLGLTGVMAVASVPKNATHGLQTGDVFSRIGDVEFPSYADGIQRIRAARGGTLSLSVIRRTESGTLTEVTLDKVPVSRKGTIGFTPTTNEESSALIARPVGTLMTIEGKTMPSSASALPLPPGTRIVRVDGVLVASLIDVLTELRKGAARNDGRGWDAKLEVVFPSRGVPGDGSQVSTITWALSDDDVSSLTHARWSSPVSVLFFRPELVTLRAQNPWEAIAMGFRETKRVMLSTYLTFLRLAQGTVAIDQLKGPVGIAHLGTIVSGRGFIWLLFFLAMISVNLAVVNFLPLPIVDGGQFLFLVYEAIRGRPVPVGVQNAVTLAGLAMIGSLFLFVTYNDIRNLFGI